MKNFFLIILISLPFFVTAQKTDEEKLIAFNESFFDAMNYQLKENYKKSNDLFFECLDLQPQSAVVLFKIAQNYARLHDYVKAKEYIVKAMKINPQNKWYAHEFLRIKIQSGEDANKLYKEIENFRPQAKNKYLIAALYRELYYRDRNKKTGGIKTIRTREPLKQNLINKLLSEQQYEKAIEEGEKLLEQNPGNPMIYYQMAQAYFHQKKYTDAIDYLDMGMDFVLNDKSLLKKYYLLYSKIYGQTGNTKKSNEFKIKYNRL